MTSIGFVGLGHMGLPMAVNLIKAGHQVTGFDLQAEALKALADAGGKAATSIEQVVVNQDVLITMLQTGEQVKEVCLTEQGLYAKAKPNLLHVDCSTIDVESSRELHSKAALLNISTLDAPVSGGVKGARLASLTFMVGGSLDAFARAKSLLSLMGKNIFYTGAAGSGQAAKICNNMILGISMIAVSEAFSLAKNLGLDAQKLYEVVNSSSGQCWVTSKYPPVPDLLPDVPANNEYQPGFTAAMMLKDLLLSQKAAADVGVNTPLGKAACLLYEKMAADGFANLDFSAIINSL